MAVTYTIQEIESALQFWGSREPAVDHALGPHVRVLAEVYALMIFYRRNTVLSSDITAAQSQAVSDALASTSSRD